MALRCYGARDRSTPARRARPLCVTLRRSLAPNFPAGALVFFIPWRVVGRESGAAQFGLVLLDPLGPALRLLIPTSPIPLSELGAALELGDELPGRRAMTARIEKPRGRALPAFSRSDFSGWRAGVLYPLAGGGRESGAASWRGAARPARAGDAV